MTAVTAQPPASTAPASSARSTDFLDGLRGLAAFYVMMHHLRYLLHEGYSDSHGMAGYTRIQKLEQYGMSIFRYGHEAVIFFFVLSGFVIHLRAAQGFKAKGAAATLGAGGYFYRRVRRLYPPLLFALLVTFAFDLWGMHLGFPIYSGQTHYSLINTTIIPDHRISTVFGNLAFVMDTTFQNHYIAVFGVDGPLWSLKYEWWFYASYPVFWWLARRSIGLATAVLSGLFVASFFPAIWPLELAREVFSMMLIWWMGALVAEIYVGRIALGLWRGAFLTLFLLPCMAMPMPLWMWGLGFSGLICLGLAWREGGGRLAVLARLEWLGAMSYTLYVCHFPLAVFMGGWLLSRSPTGEFPRSFVPVGVGALLILAFCYAAHFVVERPFTGPVRSKKAIAA
jgi:peptidoglycan/LPS O-acetylase OafA/YrhL